MGSVPLNLAGPSYAFDARELECQRSINLYAEAIESGAGRAAASLIGCPGLDLHVDLSALAGAGPVRGWHLGSDGNVYAVAGTLLVLVRADGTYASYGPLPGATRTTGPVGMADNGQGLVVVDGSALGWYLVWPTNVGTGARQTASTSPQPITDPAFTGADTVCCIDGYFLFNKPGTGGFYFSTGLTFDATDFFTAEGSPDALVGLADLHRVLWLFGTQSVEFWTDTGDATQTFAPLQGAALDIGCAAGASIARLADCLFWLGRNRDGAIVVYRGTEGYAAQRVSTTPIEQTILAGPYDDAVGLAWAEQGHLFYGLRLPSRGVMFVYDQTTALWHERASLDPATGRLVAPRFGSAMVTTGGVVLFGDAASARIYRANPASAQDVDRPMPYVRVLPHLFDAGNRRLRLDAVELVMQTGAAGVPGQDAAPVVALDWSTDGGATFGNKHLASLGAAGRRGLRVRWRRLGMARDRVSRFTFTGLVRPRIASGHATVSATRN